MADGSATLKPTKYSTMVIPFDRERHITVDAARAMVSGVEGLDPTRLETALTRGQMITYPFKQGPHVDRLDVGRVYHDAPREKRGLSIDRYFTDGKVHPLDTAGPYERRDLQLTDVAGKIIWELKDAEFPSSWYASKERWAENEAQIVAQKYFFRPNDTEWKSKLKDKINVDHENSFRHLITRVVNFFADEGDKLGYFATPEDKKTFTDELTYLTVNRMWAFNSPAWFNAGLYNEYGIAGTGNRNYWRDPTTGKVSKIEGEYTHPQLHACFIKGPRDDLESILAHVADEGAIFSCGSGIGQDIGVLRGDGEPLSGGGKASGAMSFLRVFDYAAGTIKSGGKSRRAARMTTMRHTHPDILEFIDSKLKAEYAAHILMTAGHSGSMDGDVYTMVPHQNTNHSVRIGEDLFEALARGGKVELRRIKDGKVVKEVDAQHMLKKIAYAAWRTADPGVQFDGKIQEMHTCKESGRINSTNPCSEYVFLDDTSCNLGSLNLLAFSKADGTFDVDRFERAISIATIASDIANDAGSYPVRDIAMVSPEFRTVGVGFANLGGLLMRMGIPYDSEKARALAGGLTAIMTGNVYKTSARLADHLGTFTHYELNRDSMLDVIGRHRKNLDDVKWDMVPEGFRTAAYNSWETAEADGRKVGFRNAQATVIAPTGTISFIMGCDTSGPEPAISLAIGKDLAGGGRINLHVKELGNALKNLGYTAAQVTDIVEYVREPAFTDDLGKPIPRSSVRGAPHMTPDHYAVFDTAIGNKAKEGSIAFEGHVRMVAAIQPFISGAISKTMNMPRTATVSDIYDGYLLAHDLGIKALSVFVDDSKGVSALNFGARDHTGLRRGQKEELPALAEAFKARVSVGGTPYHLIVSEYEDGRPAEIFFQSHRAGSTLGDLLKIAGVQASKALARGLELEDVVEAWMGHQMHELGGLVTGDPNIKTALSPLDWAAKFLLVQYKGDTDLAQEPEKVKIEDLRGFKNGAFRTYRRRSVDPWSFEQVIADPELGGFVKETDPRALVRAVTNGTPKQLKNERGKTCSSCGRMMTQTAPHCYSCSNCGDKVGGCGQ